MSSGRWAELAPHALPARCLRAHKAALLNRPKTEGALKRAEAKARRVGKPAESLVRDATADEDRVRCAARMVRHLASGRGVHGRTVDVHSLVNEYLHGRCGQEPDLVTEAQWLDIRAKYQELAADADQPCALGRCVVLADVSASMSGDPMAVAIGLAVLVSELSHPAFRDRFVTFESQPQWHSLAGLDSLYAKVRSAQSAPWGGSTNFAGALRLLLDTCVAARLGPDEVPEQLIVVSDMQFNAAGGGGYGYGAQAPAQAQGWSSEYAKIKGAWDAEGLPCPEIVFWNVRSGTASFPASADTEGVQMVSGFSHNLLKLFLEGTHDQGADEVDEDVSEGETEGEGEDVTAPRKKRKVSKPKVTPLDTMRRALDDEAYAPLRDAVRCCADDDADVGRRAAVTAAAVAEAAKHRHRLWQATPAPAES